MATVQQRTPPPTLVRVLGGDFSVFTVKSTSDHVNQTPASTMHIAMKQLLHPLFVNASQATRVNIVNG